MLETINLKRVIKIVFNQTCPKIYNHTFNDEIGYFVLKLFKILTFNLLQPHGFEKSIALNLCILGKLDNTFILEISW